MNNTFYDKHSYTTNNLWYVVNILVGNFKIGWIHLHFDDPLTITFEVDDFMMISMSCLLKNIYSLAK